MVKKPNPSPNRLPLKTYSKQFNLLRPGTGIRFTPPDQWGRHTAHAAPPLRLLLLALLLGAAAALYFNRAAPAPAPHSTPRPPAPSPRIMREETVAANTAPVVAIPERAAAMQPAAQPPPAAPRWRIRYGIFLLRENAERHAQSLAEKGVAAATEAALRPMIAFTIKAGPATNPDAWKNLKAEAAKLNVAPIEEVDGKYLLVGPIWLKDRALVAEKTFKAAGIRTETVEERKEKEMFKVLSAPFESAEAAKRHIGEMQINGIEGVIDE